MTMGPAPMIRMLLRSVRLGIFVFLHQRREAVKQVGDIVRAGRSLGVALEAERRLVLVLKALQRAVEQADVRGAQRVGQRLHLHGKTVVLAGDADPAVVQVLHVEVEAYWAVSNL